MLALTANGLQLKEVKKGYHYRSMLAHTSQPFLISFKVLLAAGVASKWKHYHDVHYRLYEVTKDIEGYEKSMKTHQTIIKNWMETYNEQLIEAVTNICKQEDDARYQLKFLCAGYELAYGVDYTCR